MERYESLGVVGEGSYGLVLRCRHKESGQVVAVKKFLESEDDHTVKKIALREVRMLKKLRHENLVNLIEFFRRKRRLYLVFEYVDHTILDELEATDNGLEEDTARAHIFQVLRGIAFCHQNQIIHRDIKPENVLVSRLGVVKLCDFGFARLLAGPGESCTDYVATRWYRAPELLVGDTKYGREVDVWASGCLLSEMLTGEPLFPGESDIDQLFHIIQTLGELSMSHRQLVERNPMLAGLRLPAAASTPLVASFPGWSTRAHSFVSSCLCLEPSSRPSAQELLNHDFFKFDNFPETFLPVLRQKVQQEFSTNVLLGMGARRGSSTPARRTQGRKVTGGGSPESVYGRGIVRGGPQALNTPTTTTTTTTTTVTRTENTSFPTRSSPTKHSQQTSGPRPTVTFAPLTPSHSRVQVLGGSIPTTSTITTTSSSVGGGGDEGLHIMHSALIPPLRDSHPAFSNPSSNTIALTLHITNTTNTSSPARNTRTNEKGRRSPVNMWGSSLRARGQGLCIQGQGQSTWQGQGHWEDEDHLNSLLGDAPQSTTASSRHNGGDFTRTSDHSRPSDLARHPYTISLDRTKDLVARDSTFRDFTRDPLKEIKDNSREHPTRDPLGPRDSLRRPRLEVMGWAKPRLLNDDLSLPNVPGVTSCMNGGNTSPKKSVIGGVDESGVSSRPQRVTMPILNTIQRSSATSSESTPPSSPLANLPYV